MDVIENPCSVRSLQANWELSKTCFISFVRCLTSARCFNSFAGCLTSTHCFILFVGCLTSTPLHFLSRMLDIHTSCWQQSSVQHMVGGGVGRGGTPHQLLLVILLHDPQSSRVFFFQGSPGCPTPPLAQSARAGFSQCSPGLPAAGTFPALLQLWRTWGLWQGRLSAASGNKQSLFVSEPTLTWVMKYEGDQFHRSSAAGGNKQSLFVSEPTLTWVMKYEGDQFHRSSAAGGNKQSLFVSEPTLTWVMKYEGDQFHRSSAAGGNEQSLSVSEPTLTRVMKYKGKSIPPNLHNNQTPDIFLQHPSFICHRSQE